MMRAGRSDYRQVTQEICYLVQGPISAEVVSTQAAEMVREAMEIARDLKDKLGIFSTLGGLACVAVAMGWAERAAQLFGAAEVVAKASGYAGDRVDQHEVDRQLAAARSILKRETFDAAWARGQNMSSEEAIAYALSEQRVTS
jgi:hypothetical protein